AREDRRQHALARLRRTGRRLRAHLLHRRHDGRELPGGLDGAPARADGTARLLRPRRPRRLPRGDHARAAHRDLPPLRDDPELRRRHPGVDHHHPEPHDRHAARAGIDRHARPHRRGKEPARPDGPDRAGAHPRRDGLPARVRLDPANRRRLLGMLSRADLIAAYNRTVATLGATSIPDWLKTVEPQWADRYRVMSVEVPQRWVGRTLREIDCRARYGVAVLVVHP